MSILLQKFLIFDNPYKLIIVWNKLNATVKILLNYFYKEHKSTAFSN